MGTSLSYLLAGITPLFSFIIKEVSSVFIIDYNMSFVNTLSTMMLIVLSVVLAQTGDYLIAIVPCGVLFKICWWGWKYPVLNIIAASIIGMVFFSLLLQFHQLNPQAVNTVSFLTTLDTTKQ